MSRRTEEGGESGSWAMIVLTNVGGFRLWHGHKKGPKVVKQLLDVLLLPVLCEKRSELNDGRLLHLPQVGGVARDWKGAAFALSAHAPRPWWRRGVTLHID